MYTRYVPCIVIYDHIQYHTFYITYYIRYLIYYIVYTIYYILYIIYFILCIIQCAARYPATVPFCFWAFWLVIFYIYAARKHHFWVILEVRGPILEARKPILRISRILVILDAVGDESGTPFGGQNLSTNPLLGVLRFWCLFDASFVSFFGFWVAGGSILGVILALFGKPLVPLNVSKHSACHAFRA